MHIPFCGKRCGYCSFNTAVYQAEAVPRYLKALGREIEMWGARAWADRVTIGTVFFGGGTPSLLTPEELGGVLDALRRAFRVPAEAEITVECNPESVTAARLAGYRERGVSRISMGVQSLDDRVLPTLDRLHDAAGARRAYETARAAGFDDVSCDLIYGLPGLDLATWDATVRELIAWEPDHLSAYGLTLDEGSRWHATGVTGLPPEETVTAQYWRLAERAAAAGFEHYEISNYAQPGKRSAHNQVYWQAEEYLAFGAGACGFVDRVRWGNVKPAERYAALTEAGALPIGTHEILTDRQMLAERLVLGLRLSDGIPRAWLDERLALERGRLPEHLTEWAARGLLIETPDRIRLTESGFLLSDSLFTELL